MRDERETRIYRRLVLRSARAELKLARLRKRLRSDDTHRKFRLGEIGVQLGWNKLVPEDMKRRIEAVHDVLADRTTHPNLYARGQRFHAEREHRADMVPLDSSFESLDDFRARRHHQIVLGARLLQDGRERIDPVIVLGAMLLTEERATRDAVS